MPEMQMTPGMQCGMPMPVAAPSPITEFILCWPGAPSPTAEQMAMDPTSCCTPGGGSTHELVWDRRGGGEVFWVSGQMYDHVARITLDGHADYFPMPKDSAPHGMAYDHDGQLWVTLEGSGYLAPIARDGGVGELIDVGIYPTTGGRLNTRPHGLAVASDGALWFTGKLTNTVGRVAEGVVQHFELPTIGAVPIYLAAGPHRDMFCSELTGSRIAHISRKGLVREYVTPSANSRPIAIAMAPDGKSAWYSTEAGGSVGRIDLLLPNDDPHKVVEFPVPLTRRDAILAGLVFDSDGALWVQQYCPAPPTGAMPTGDDQIVRFGPELLTAPPGDLTGVPIAYFRAPSRGTVMHRITQGPDGNIWFTELGINRVGRLQRT